MHLAAVLPTEPSTNQNEVARCGLALPASDQESRDNVELRVLLGDVEVHALPARPSARTPRHCAASMAPDQRGPPGCTGARPTGSTDDSLIFSPAAHAVHYRDRPAIPRIVCVTACRDMAGGPRPGRRCQSTLNRPPDNKVAGRRRLSKYHESNDPTVAAPKLRGGEAEAWAGRLESVQSNARRPEE